MSITVLQALLITLFCIISNLMFPLLGDIGGYFGLGRPLIAGTITGLILGDVKTGMMIGRQPERSVHELSGSRQRNVHGCNHGPVTSPRRFPWRAVMIRPWRWHCPFPLACSAPCSLPCRTRSACSFSHKCDEYAAKGQVKKMWLVGIGIPLVVFNVIRAIPRS